MMLWKSLRPDVFAMVLKHWVQGRAAPVDREGGASAGTAPADDRRVPVK